jgi:MFS family permease
MTADSPNRTRRWAILALLGIAQLMVVLDATIVTIALPSAQRALHFTNENRQWIVTAYALAFGSLLLLGGRLSDLFGRKWTFIAGLSGFAMASAVGGAAQSFGGRFDLCLAPDLTTARLVQVRHSDRGRMSRELRLHEARSRSRSASTLSTKLCKT